MIAFTRLGVAGKLGASGDGAPLEGKGGGGGGEEVDGGVSLRCAFGMWYGFGSLMMRYEYTQRVDDRRYDSTRSYVQTW